MLAAAAVAAAANADFYDGQEVFVSGFASSSVFGNTSWGYAAGQGAYTLNQFDAFYDAVYGPDYEILMISEVNDPNSVTFVINYTSFFPADYEFHSLEIVGLKNDGSILGVQGNSTGFATDGNVVTWQGTGAELAGLGELVFKVYQVPAPGAVALLGLAGLARNRRRA